MGYSTLSGPRFTDKLHRLIGVKIWLFLSANEKKHKDGNTGGYGLHRCCCNEVVTVCVEQKKVLSNQGGNRTPHLLEGRFPGRTFDFGLPFFSIRIHVKQTR